MSRRAATGWRVLATALAVCGLEAAWARTAVVSGPAPPRVFSPIRPAGGQVVGWWLELSQHRQTLPWGPEGLYQEQVTTLTLQPRAEWRLDRSTGPAAGPGRPDAPGAAEDPGWSGRPYWKAFVAMPVRLADRWLRWQGPQGTGEVRRLHVGMGPGRAGLAYFRPIPARLATVEAAAAALLAPDGDRPGVGVAASVAISAVRDPALAGAAWEVSWGGAATEGVDHRVSAYWRHFVTESLVVSMGVSVRIGGRDLALSGQLRSGFAWVVRDGLQWELIVAHPLGGEGPFSVEVGVVAGELE